MSNLIQIESINKEEFKSIIETIIDKKMDSVKKQDQPENITVDVCAKTLNVSKQTVWNYIKRGVLPAKKISRNYVINTEDLKTVLKDVKSLKYRRHG